MQSAAGLRARPGGGAAQVVKGPVVMHFDACSGGVEGAMIVLQAEQKLEVVFALMRELSDQYGTSELAGVYSTKRIAEVVASDLIGRTFIREIKLDALPWKHR